MKRWGGILFGVLALLPVAGCVAPRASESSVRPTPASVAARTASDNDKLIAYYEHVRRIPAAELSREHDAVRQLYANGSSDYLRLRYAILLSVAGAAFNDDARAAEVLEPLVKNKTAALHHLAFMVNAQIQEQRRGQGLQQKLDALKSLEKNLIERDPGAAKRR